MRTATLKSVPDARHKLPSVPMRIGISTCLLGRNVRFDGNHKKDDLILESLGPYVEWVPVCPEVEAGFGIPRPPMRLLRMGGELQMQITRSGEDLTPAMTAYSHKRVAQLVSEGLCGYILKKDSPSCGMERVKVYGSKGGAPEKSGVGLFAAELLERMPNLPVEEEGRLHDPALRENFIERIFAFARLQALWQSKWKPGDLVRFHTAHKYLLMAHSPVAYQALGRAVARVKETPRAALREGYEAGLMQALRKPATRRQHVNVLQHLAGYFKEQLRPEEKLGLQEVLSEFRAGLVPLIVPLTLIKQYVRVHGVDYLKGQVYLEQSPRELLLRNHV